MIHFKQIIGFKNYLSFIRLIVMLFITLSCNYSQAQTTHTLSYTTINASVAAIIQGHLNNGDNVVVTSTSSITVSDGVNILKTTGSDATLTLKANFRVTMGINTSIRSTSSKLNLVFWSNATNNTATKGMIRFGNHTSVGANVIVETNGGHLWMGGGANNLSWNGLTIGDGYAWGSASPGGNGWYGLELYGDCRFITSGGDISLNGRSTDQTSGQGETYGIFIIKSIFNAGSGNITTNTVTDGTSPSSGSSTGIGIAGDGGFTTTTGNITITNAINVQGNTNGIARGIYLERNSTGNMSGNPVISSNQGNVSINTTFTSPATQKWYIDLNELNFLREKSSTASNFTEPLRELFNNSTTTFSSSAQNVATVTNAGLVSLVGTGSTDITGVLARNDWNTIDSRWRYRINVENKADPDLTFAQAEVYKQISDPNFTLTATQQNQGGGTLGAISYTTSNRSVATVNDASTGEVTIVGEGTTVISASSASTVTYAQGNASYTLYVTNGLVVFTTNAVENNGIVTVSGNVVSDGGNAVTERGFVYASTSAPTISDTKVVIGSGTGTFSGNTPSLASGTYYFRAFATNSTGTVYGSEYSLPVVAPIVSPTITSFTPTIAGNGETVVITGTGFTGVTSVNFGNQAATSFVVDSDTQITAIVGNGASGAVTVSNSAGTDNETGFIFKVVEYLFENNTLDNTDANLDGTLVGAAAYNAGASGQAICFQNTYTDGATVSNYLQLPSNLIRGLGTTFTISLRFKTDSRGALLGYQAVDVGGNSTSNYIPLLYVKEDGKLAAMIWGGSSVEAVSTTRVDDNNWHKVDFSVAPGSISIYIDDVLEGTGNVTVNHLSMTFNQLAASSIGNYYGRPAGSLWEGFSGCIDDFVIFQAALSQSQIQQATALPQPTITSFTPTTSQEGTVVTITGTNFTGATSVIFGGVAAQSFTVVSDTEITAVVPSNASQDNIVQVITAGGTASATGFSFTAAPSAPTNLVATPGNGEVEISFSPGADGGSPITNYEYSLDGGQTWVALNPADATSPITIAGLNNGTQYSIELRALNNVGAGATSATVTATPTVPIVTSSITSFTPTIAGNGETVVINGTGFTGVTSVNFGNQAATSFVVDSDTQITAIVGNGASGAVTVTNSAGTDNETGFIFKVVEYKFENNTLDNTDANLDANIVGTASYAPGASGQAICFTNTNATTATTVQNYLTMPSDLIRNRAVNFTISLRFKTSTWGAILGYQNRGVGDPNGGDYVPILYIQQDGKLSANLWQNIGNVGSPIRVLSANRVDDGNWHKVEFSAASGSISIYLDDVLVGSSNGSVNHLSMSFNQLGAANTEGAAWPGVPVTGWLGFNGCIDEFFIIDQSLTIEQIQQVTALPQPTIASFTPTTSQEGTVVTITGTNFTGATSVIFGGVSIQSFTVVSDTEITAVVPSNASQNNIVQVITAGGTASATGFSFTAAPSAPTNLVATPGNGEVEISFSPGADGGSPITNYEYSLDGGTTWLTNASAVSSSPITIGGLSDGTTYNIILRAVNSIARSVASANVSVTTITPDLSTFGCITIVTSGGAAEGSTWTYTNNIIRPNSATDVNINASDVLSKMALGDLTIAGKCITVNADLNYTADDNSITLKASGNIVQNASKTITTNGGDVIFWSNADGQIADASVLLRDGSAISTSGGHLWIGGGSGTSTWNGLTVGDGFAVSGISILAPVSNAFYAGVYLEKTAINTNGGNVYLAGAGTSVGTTRHNSIVTFDVNDINAGSGTITLKGGSGTTSGRGMVVSMHNTLRPGSLTLASTSTEASAINIDTNSTEQMGTAVEGTFNVESTNAGGISFTSLGGGTNPALRLGFSSSSSGVLNVLANSGDIVVNLGERGINIQNSQSNASIGGKANTAVVSSASDIQFISNDVTAAGALNFSTSGSLIIEPFGTSFSSTLNTTSLTYSGGISGLTLGKSGNTSDITIGSTTTIAGPINVYGGSLSINGALTTTDDINLHATGAVSQTAAIASNALSLNGTGTFTLNNTSNNVAIIAGGSNATKLGSVSFTDASGGLTIGTIGSNSGLTAAGTILVETLADDLTIAKDITTDNTTANAITINAGKSAAIGTTTGGDIIVSGTPSVTTGTGGIAKLFSGSEGGSTGLTALVGGATNIRLGVDETTTSFSPSLSASNNYALYRAALPEAPTNLQATPGNGEVAISFTPGNDNGSAITNYEYTLDGGQTWIALNPADGSSPITIPGLDNGTAYSIQLRAVNANGTSDASMTVFISPSTPFTLKYDTTVSAASDLTIEISLGGAPNVTVDWGDGTTDQFTTSGFKPHTYANDGVYIVKIYGSLTTPRTFDNNPRLQELIEIIDWGEVGWTSFNSICASANNLIAVPSTIPSTVTDLSFAFYFASQFNQDISTWDVSNVTSLRNMFNASAFNQDISNWDVSNVTDLNGTFSQCPFNQDISNWDVSNVTNMSTLFFANTQFNQDISSWDVSNVTNMSYMFYVASAFNKDISNWNVSNVTNMEWIFRNASSFNQNLGDWDMSNVTNVTDMFRNSGLSMNNYDQILIGWANQTLKNNLNFTSPTTYSCLAASSRENIINDFNWTIIDSGFLDNVLPTATTQDLTVQLNASGSATITAAQIDNGSTDNCGIATITVNPNSFTAANLGDNTVTLTVTDTSGNVSTATAVVTVEDNIAPTAITQNITVNLDANGNATITTAQIDNGSTDNAGIASMTVSPNAFTCEDLGTNTVILTVTDTSGNISTATATVTVQDTVLPTVITQDITVQLNASGAATITAAQIDNGSTDNCGIASMTVSPNTFTCDDLGPITVTLTVTDTSGNVATAVAIVTVQDLVAPVVSTTSIASTPDINGYTCGATFSFETTQTTCFVTKSIAKPIWADSCALTYTQSADNNVILTNLGDMVLGNFPLGTTTITFTSTDLSGNTSSCNVLVTVVDSVAPVLSQCPTGGTYEVDSNLCSLQLNLSSPLIIDNCGVSTVTYATAGATELSGIGFPSSLVFNLGVTQVLYTVTDESGNATTCSYAITVVDTTAPEIQAENFTVSVTSGCSEDVALGVTATDNCGTPTLVGARSDGLALTSAFPLGTTTVTWTATDASGNTFTATQEITVVDNAAPVIAGMPANITIGNDAGSCDATVTWTAPTATDNCAGVTLTSSHLPGDLFALGTTTVTYTATDAAGNTSSASFTVTVNDTENPTITAPADVTVSANASCLAFNVVLGSPVTSDNCGVGFVTNDAPGTFLLGITTVTWTVTDNAGNTATATQNVTVEDITAPTIFAPTDLTVNANNDCEAVIANLGNVVATDNCDTVTVTNDAPAAFPLGTTTVTWIATDASGNTSTATQEITVVDTTAPVVLAPQSITISAGVDSCSVTNVDLGVPTATDNCGITSVTNDAPTTFPSGTTTVIWTATDNAGNTSTASQTVTVIDQVAPVALTQNITAALSNEGTVTISASQIDNGSFDNCGGVTLSVAPNTFGCSQIGTNEVVLTVTDASGNSSTATATVTIVDTTAPLALVSPVTVSLNAQGLATLTASQVNNGSFDNCGIAQISISQTSFDCDDVGSNTIQFTATDFSGNSTTVNATVIVVDTIAPTIVTQNLTLDVSYEEPVTISPDEISLGTFDNCGIDYMILSQNTFGCEDFGENVVELTVVDLSGNESRSTFTVTVNRCTVRVSEAVTPNGDGINDTWMIYNIEQYPNNRVRVFNRWGDKVFESKSYRNTWDGSYRNRSQKLPEAGSYYYQLDLDDDGVIDQDGWIYITR